MYDVHKTSTWSVRQSVKQERLRGLAVTSDFTVLFPALTAACIFHSISHNNHGGLWIEHTSG